MSNCSPVPEFRRVLPFVCWACCTVSAVGAALSQDPPHTDDPATSHREPTRLERWLAMPHMRTSNACFLDDYEPTPEEIANTPPRDDGQHFGPCGGVVDPYFATPCVYTGPSGDLGPSGHALGARITFTFRLPQNHAGVRLDIGTGTNSGGLVDIFGAGEVDLGREYIRQAIAAWSRAGGLEVEEELCTATRFLSRRTGVTNTGLAAFPSQTGQGTLSPGEIHIRIAQVSSSRADYRAMRMMLAHEFGHAIGFLHVIPPRSASLMEGVIPRGVFGLSPYERRALARTYGDRFVGVSTSPEVPVPANSHWEGAKDFGNLAPSAGVSRSVRERDMSINCTAPVSGVTHDDWYQFELSEASSTVLSVQPTGGAQWNPGLVEGPSDLTPVLFDATAAAMLTMRLYIADSSGNIDPEDDPDYEITADRGKPAIITQTLQPGKYFLRVSGPSDCADWVDLQDPEDPRPNHFVQLYTLGLRINDAKFPPVAIAGVTKRIAYANQLSFFMGHLNSYAQEPGAQIVYYGWDFDEDGDTDNMDDEQTDKPWTTRPIVSHIFTQTGDIDITLWVIDSFGSVATDSITVRVIAENTSCDVTP